MDRTEYEPRHYRKASPSVCTRDTIRNIRPTGKKTRMIFLKDGSTATGGFAPYASRFSDGGYIHGVPVNEPRKALIEYSPSLGTTPRSHMCVRNATSHSKFIFDWAPVNETIIFVLE